jgi:hypothetical protein
MIIGLLAALLAAAWVYTDSRALAVRGVRVGGTSWKPIGWAAATFLVLILFLPLYLYQRSKALRVTLPETSAFCTECGAALPPDAAYCPRCGSRVVTSPSEWSPR